MSITAYIFGKDNTLRVEESLDFLTDHKENELLWIDIETKEEAELNKIAEHFSLHELTVEDCLTPGHAPKLEDFGHYLFFIFRALNPGSELPRVEINSDVINSLTETHTNEADNEEEELTRSISIYLSESFVISHRMYPMPWLDALLRQVKRRPDTFFEGGTNELTHSILDVLIDRFLRGLSFFENQIDYLEDNVIKKPDDFDMQVVLELKRQLITIKHIMRDQKAVISRLAVDGNLIKDKQLRRYFRDIEENTNNAINTIDKQIDNLVGLRDVYFAMANVRLGDIMRILAIITTIAVPLNLVVGLYGMNFDAIPLLHNQYGFWVVMILMLCVAGIMLLFFRKKRWL